ncbi:MAG: hypothetical protein GY842_24080 [bacterium]|nr:hypothetical protein [bacterium]
MTEPGSTQPTLIRRLLQPPGQYRTGALCAAVQVHWFIRLRWVAVGAGVLAYGLARRFDEVPRRPAYLLAVVAALVLLNLVCLVWGRRVNRLTREDETDSDTSGAVLLFANTQMVTDLVLLTVMIHLFGGLVSPLVMFYVFHVAIAALLLTPLNALLQAIWALLLYSVVVFGERSGWLGQHMPLVSLEYELGLVQSVAFSSIVYITTATGLLGIWYLVSRVATVLDARERELRETTEALIASHEAIEELQARRARFMLTAAHQLKSPLAGIQTLAGLIRDGIISGDAVAGTTAKIVRRCKEAIGQVTELLTLARLKDEGPERHEKAQTPVVATCQELIANFRDNAQEQGIEIKLNVLTDDDPCVRVDPRDLKDCLGNLIENAVKYSGDGKLVEVTTRFEQGGATVTVRDEGLGMDSETLEVVFDEFRRGNQALAMQIGGSGLGLSIVREVLEHAGGQITVCSATGEGSTFRVWLPVAPISAESAERRPPGSGYPGDSNKLSKPLPQRSEETAYAGSNCREE